MNSQNNEFVISYLTLRQMIGWIGLLMPITVRLGAYLFEGIHTTAETLAVVAFAAAWLVKGQTILKD